MTTPSAPDAGDPAERGPTQAPDQAAFYRQARADQPGPLAGIRVLEATNYGAGPFCGMVLADFGAESIKAEAPAGDPIRLLSPFVDGVPGSRTALGTCPSTATRRASRWTCVGPKDKRCSAAWPRRWTSWWRTTPRA